MLICGLISLRTFVARNPSPMQKLKLDELNRKDISAFKKADKLPVVVALDDIRSMSNEGSVFRSSDAFLIEKIILCGITAQPPHRDIQKTALGATESVEWEYIQDINEAVQGLKNSGYCIIGVEQTDSSVLLTNWKIDKSKKYAFVFGNEVNGITEKVLPLLDYSLEIPQEGTKHSLNVSVAAGIVLFETYRQFGKS